MNSRAPRSDHPVRADQGAMPLALVLVTFVLIFAAIAATTAATQIVSNRSETAVRAAGWALESALNRAAERVRTAGFPADLPTEQQATWFESADEGYRYRWWVEPGQSDQALVVVAQVELAGAPSAQPPVFQAGKAYLWNPVRGEWSITGYFPDME